MQVFTPSYLTLTQLCESKFTLKKVISETEYKLIAWVQDFQNRSSILKITSNRQTVEGECLKQLKHPNIVSLLDFFTIGDSTVLQLQKIPGNPLVEILAPSPLSESESSYIMYSIASALSHIHSKGWLHLDVKPDNIIYDRVSKSVCLVDFDSSLPISQKKRTPRSVGTLEYQAPEVRQKKYIGPEADVWCLGVTLYVMITGYFPFSQEELNLNKGDIIFPPSLSRGCIILLRQMLQIHYQKRISISRILKSPWIKRPETPLHHDDFTRSVSRIQRKNTWTFCQSPRFSKLCLLK